MDVESVQPMSKRPWVVLRRLPHHAIEAQSTQGRTHQRCHERLASAWSLLRCYNHNSSDCDLRCLEVKPGIFVETLFTQAKLLCTCPFLKRSAWLWGLLLLLKIWFVFISTVWQAANVPGFLSRKFAKWTPSRLRVWTVPLYHPAGRIDWAMFGDQTEICT